VARALEVILGKRRVEAMSTVSDRFPVEAATGPRISAVIPSGKE